MRESRTPGMEGCSHNRVCHVCRRLLNIFLKEGFQKASLPPTVKELRINMHKQWSPQLPDWHFNVPIICWGRRRLPRAAEAADLSVSASAHKADGTKIVESV